MSVFVPLAEILPELAATETRSIRQPKTLSTLLSNREYFFHESFCAEHNCDCRKAMINVTDRKGNLLTTLSYGWEEPAYYVSQHFDEESAEELSGVSIDLSAPHCKNADEMIMLFRMVLEDKAYADRIVEHYNLFKESIVDQNYIPSELMDDEFCDEIDYTEAEMTPAFMDQMVFRTIKKMEATAAKLSIKVGRNELCPCGSNKKYKKCCIANAKYHNERYYSIPYYSVSEMADSDVFLVHALSIEQLFCRLDPKYHFNDMVILKMLEFQLEIFYYKSNGFEAAFNSDADAGIMLLNSLLCTITKDIFKDKPDELAYKILAAIYHSVLRRGANRRAYMDFLISFSPSKSFDKLMAS